MNSGDPLTIAERHALVLASDLWDALVGVVTHGPTRAGDIAELGVHIHAIQQAVLAQAGARAYPELYRLLGEAP